MRRRSRGIAMLLAAAAATATAKAQQTQRVQQAPAHNPPARQPFPAPSGATPQEPERSPFEYVYEGTERSFERDDYRELHLHGGFRLRAPQLGLELRGEHALFLLDLEEARRLAQPAATNNGLPVRPATEPSPRRRLSPDEMRARLERSLRAVGGEQPLPQGGESERVFDLFRYAYCEGGIVAVQNGREVLRCERLWISPVDDRIVVENAELRYVSDTARGEQTLVVRGPRLVKHGRRWVGRDLVLTTCVAGHPHAALAVGEAEIIERDGEFEIVSRGQTLQVGGTNVLPLPDARFFTGSQSEFPIRRMSASYSGLLGMQAEVVLGLPWNTTGGKLHQLLTGRPEHEFRGDWEFGVGWIEARGVPLEGALTYSAKDLYEGRTEVFWLDDRGRNIREIRNDFAGNLVEEQSRGVVRSQNRAHLGETTHVDFVAFHGTDEAAYSEFFVGPYRTEEVPETSVYLHHRDGNHLLTVGTRHNLSDFSYRDNRSIAERFVEELPVLTYQWLAQPVGATPWDTPIVVDLETEIGQRRSDYDDLATTRVSDRTLRVDQLAEMSTPFHAWGLSIRPYASARGTYYDQTVDGDDEGRIALEAGVQFGTRLSQTWSWLDEEGRQGVRHVIAPRVTYRNRYHVDDQGSEFFRFDPIDTLGEQQLVRLEVRNLVQKMAKTADGGREPRDFLFLDLAQDLFPDRTRDNNGEELGLFYYDLLVRPEIPGMPFENFAFALYGDHDWNDGMRTLDTELQFGKVLGCDWTVEYREDRVVEGAVGLVARTQLLDRWNLFVATQRDLDRDEWLAYSFGLRRDDHDWSIELLASYNPFSDETTFRIEFLPRLGGLNQPRRDRFGGVDPRAQSVFNY
jgi:hypothetical protein